MRSCESNRRKGKSRTVSHRWLPDFSKDCFYRHPSVNKGFSLLAGAGTSNDTEGCGEVHSTPMRTDGRRSHVCFASIGKGHSAA